MQQETSHGRRHVTRRQLLQSFALAGLGVVLGGPPLASRTSAEVASATHQWAFVVDLRRCDGCEKCTQACQQTHFLGKDQTWIKVYKMTNSEGQAYTMPRLCMHCENPPCQRVCPVGATYRNSEGVVLVDQSICIGCRTCMAACPYEARYFNWGDPIPAPTGIGPTMPEFPVPQRKGTVGKCILCVHNTREGKLPACVQACTMDALYIGDIVVDAAANSRQTVKLSQLLRENDAVRFREQLGTRPRVWYIPGHGQKLDF